MRRVLKYLNWLPVVVVILWMGHSLAQITVSDIDSSRFMEVKRAAGHALIPFWHAAVAVHAPPASGTLSILARPAASIPATASASGSSVA